MSSPASTHSARAALQAAHAAYPQAWQMAEAMRETRGRPGIPNWPDWCYLPMGGWYAAVARIRNGGHALRDLAAIGDVSRLAALGTWRMTQGVFRLDEALREHLSTVSLPADVPCAVLQRLPQWCVYLETPGADWQGKAVAGYWAHLECDANHGGTELRLLLDTASGLLPLAIPLTDGPLAAAVQAARQPAVRVPTSEQPGPAPAAPAADLTPWVLPVVHLCSEHARFSRDGEADRPGNPAARKTKRGMQRFAAPSPTVWTVT